MLIFSKKGFLSLLGDTGDTSYFFLHCPEFTEARQTFFYNIQSIDKTLMSQIVSLLTRLVLCGDPKRNSNVN